MLAIPPWSCTNTISVFTTPGFEIINNLFELKVFTSKKMVNYNFDNIKF